MRCCRSASHDVAAVKSLSRVSWARRERAVGVLETACNAALCIRVLAWSARRQRSSSPSPNPFRFDRAELAGAVGDLGVLVPIAVALIVKNGLTPTAVLLPAGLLYVVAGLIYRLPVPVQPLKAFGAIAIAHGFGADDIAAGALLMGMLFLVLGASGLLDWVAKVFPHPIIRGIQLSVGLLFCQLAWRLVSATPKAFTDHRHSVWWLAGATVVVIAAALLLRRHQITLVFLVRLPWWRWC